MRDETYYYDKFLTLYTQVNTLENLELITAELAEDMRQNLTSLKTIAIEADEKRLMDEEAK